jgi:exopolysaccharide biosynthesis protein
VLDSQRQMPYGKMIRKSKRFLLALIVFLQAAATLAQDFQPVRRGVEYLQITRGVKSADEATGPFVIHLLKIDLHSADLKVVHAMDEAIGLETVSSMAARYGALAAINAGFFATTGTYRGDDVSVLKIDGKWLSEPANNRAAVGFIKRNNQTEIIFGHLTFKGSVETAKGGSHKIDGINRPRAVNELIVYTPEFHKTTLTNPNGIEIIIKQGRVTQIRDQEGSTRIPENGSVISATGSARDWLLKNVTAGQRLNVKLEMIPLEKESAASWHQALNIVSGVPQLIREGHIEITSELEKSSIKFVTDRHPRTAIARLNDGKLLLLAVDGRQPGYSTGMSLTALAELLLEFGATDAINLDGGGSTTIFLNGKVVNKPSDASGERPVSDAILIFEKIVNSKQ